MLADEPTGNLDSAKKVEIMELLVKLNQTLGITIAMVTHETDMARFVARIITFRDGRVIDPNELPPSWPSPASGTSALSRSGP